MTRLFIALLFIVSGVAFAQEKSLEDESADFSPDRQLLLYYQSFAKEEALPDFGLFKLAVTGYFNLKDSDRIGQADIVTIIDFRKPSNQKRLWIVDLKARSVLYHTLVAHGRNTGNLYAESFSNVPNSNTSSLGFYTTAQTYMGKHGLSLRLDGLEKGFNDKARERAIVLHGADYVSKDFVKAHGRLGRSFGCPSVPMAVHKEVINTIKDGTCLFIFYPDRNYLSKSKLLQPTNLVAQVQKLTSEPAANAAAPLGSSR
ncbi:MAG: murein L,D-transpeptidase catalytic domain family protein [Imperialibacter sp.]